MHWDQRFGPFYPSPGGHWIAYNLLFIIKKGSKETFLNRGTFPLDKSTDIELHGKNIQLLIVDKYY